MEGLVILLSFLLIGPLAMLFGADSRSWDERGWWPGSARSLDEPAIRRAPVEPRWGEVAVGRNAPAGCTTSAHPA